MMATEEDTAKGCLKVDWT